MLMLGLGTDSASEGTPPRGRGGWVTEGGRGGTIPRTVCLVPSGFWFSGAGAVGCLVALLCLTAARLLLFFAVCFGGCSACKAYSRCRNLQSCYGEAMLKVLCIQILPEYAMRCIIIHQNSNAKIAADEMFHTTPTTLLLSRTLTNCIRCFFI